MKEKRVSVNGVKIYPFISMEDLIDYVVDKKNLLIAINAGKIGRVDDDFRNMVSENIGYADGIGALKAIKKAGFKDASKIPGCDIWLKIIERQYKISTFYFVGGKQEIIEAVIKKLKIDYPGINIAGYRNGYIKNTSEEELLIQDIVEKKPEYVFVAMGSPKQELLMKKMLRFHKALYQGLGGSFDVYTGSVKRTPQWLIDMGVDGPYRVITSFSKARWNRFWSDLAIMIKIAFGFYEIKVTD
jgi:UDP-N-acetyl-D-mannosaminouronate:lipid I N-acetyl-D-mannosaminouronosyltransferase